MTRTWTRDWAMVHVTVAVVAAADAATATDGGGCRARWPRAKSEALAQAMVTAVRVNYVGRDGRILLTDVARVEEVEVVVVEDAEENPLGGGAGGDGGGAAAVEAELFATRHADILLQSGCGNAGAWSNPHQRRIAAVAAVRARAADGRHCHCHCLGQLRPMTS
jgi:hypothetical protein